MGVSLLGSVLWIFVLYLSEVLLASVFPSVISAAFLSTLAFTSPLTPNRLELLVFIDVTDDAFESLTKWFILNDCKPKLLLTNVFGVSDKLTYNEINNSTK